MSGLCSGFAMIVRKERIKEWLQEEKSAILTRKPAGSQQFT